MASKNASDEYDFDTARKRGREAMWVNVAGIICSIVTGIIIIIIVFTTTLIIASEIEDNIEDWENNNITVVLEGLTTSKPT